MRVIIWFWSWWQPVIELAFDPKHDERGFDVAFYPPGMWSNRRPIEFMPPIWSK